MSRIDLTQDGHFVPYTLREIAGRTPRAVTHCLFTRDGEILRLEIDAEDPDILSMVATIPRESPDRFLFEEDGVQVALATPGTVMGDRPATGSRPRA